MKPLVSIIIPTLNEEKILEKTLRSLRELHSIPYEIIVSDGRSTDRTIEIAKKYADKVVVYEGTIRQTIANGRNLGGNAARSEYLLFLDADMYIPDINTFFEKALDDFRTRKLVALTAYLKVFPEMANIPDKFLYWFFNRMFYILDNVFHYGVSYGEFQMVRGDIYKKLGGYNERLAVAEDHEFFKRVSREGRVYIDPRLVVFHTSRRAHKVGWPKLLWSWWVNQASVMTRGKSVYSEWKEIR